MSLNTNIFKIQHNNVKPRKGSILISEPFSQDAYFKRSVVFLVEHSQENTLGFILNKPVSFSIIEAISDFPDVNMPLNLGGPVATDTIHFIHTLGNRIPNSIHVHGNIYWGGDFSVMKKLINQNKVPPGEVKFFIGYSGWDKGQLTNELENNYWLVCNVPDNFIMQENKSYWKKAVLKAGEKYKVWTNYPEDPNHN